MAVNSKYKNLVIYYFSGTGNARQSARWIIQDAKEASLVTKLINIDRFKQVRWPDLDEGNTLVGFCYPTHGFNAPPIVLKFIRSFPKAKARDVFLLNTRAGMKLSRLFLPGLSGLALIVPLLMLWLKGYRIMALRPVDLPSNWISLHPGLKKSVVNSIFKRWHGKLKKFSNKLLQGKRMYPALWTLPIDLAISPISIGYYVFGRFMLAKTFIATMDCNGCGLCERRCPTESIKMINNLPYWKYTCESCMRCMNHCPKRAIESAHSFTAILWYLAWSLVPAAIFAFLVKNGYVEFGSGWQATLFYYFIEIPLAFLLVYIAYKTLHFLMRYKFVNRLIAYTSFTHFKFWRRYRAPEKF